MKKWGRAFWQGMKIEASERRIEKEKDAFKANMWSKVNSWLVDIDKRPAAGQQEEEEVKGQNSDLDECLNI